MLLRNKGTKDSYHVPSGIGKAMIHAGLAEEVLPEVKPKSAPSTKWSVVKGQRVGDYQYPPEIRFHCSCGGVYAGSMTGPTAANQVFRHQREHIGIAEPVPTHIAEQYMELRRQHFARSKHFRRDADGRPVNYEAERRAAEINRQLLIDEAKVSVAKAKKVGVGQ